MTSKQSSLCVRFWISEPKGRTRFFQEVSSPPTTPELVLSVKVRLGNPPSGRSSKRDPISADAFETSRLLLRLFEMKLFEDLVCFENKRGFKGTGINERVRWETVGFVPPKQNDFYRWRRWTNRYDWPKNVRTDGEKRKTSEKPVPNRLYHNKFRVQITVITNIFSALRYLSST